MVDLSSLRPEVRGPIAEHIALYLRDPVKAHIWDASVIGVPSVIRALLLRMRGRSSGEERHVVLQYFEVDAKFTVFGSKGGAADHPQWYKNLLANPECEIQVAAFGAKAIARTIEGEERQRYWQAISAEQPRYIEYQARTERLIPIVVFDLLDASQDPLALPG